MVVKHNIYSFYCIVLSISEQMVILAYITNIYVHVMLTKMIVFMLQLYSSGASSHIIRKIMIRS